MKFCFEFLVTNRLYVELNRENQGQKLENLAINYEKFLIKFRVKFKHFASRV